MMINKRLLRETPVRALQLLCAPKMTDPKNADYLGFGTVTDLGDGKCSIVTTIDKSLAPLDLWGYITPINIYLNRLPLDALFEELAPKVTLRTPFKMSDVFHQIESVYGIRFDARDYIETTITSMSGDTILVRAGDQSLRWYGHYMLKLHEVGNAQ